MTIEKIREMLAGITQGEWEVDKYGGNVWAKDDGRGKGKMHIAEMRGWGHLTGQGLGACGLGEEVAVKEQNANAAFVASAPAIVRWLVQQLGIESGLRIEADLKVIGVEKERDDALAEVKRLREWMEDIRDSAWGDSSVLDIVQAKIADALSEGSE